MRFDQDGEGAAAMSDIVERLLNRAANAVIIKEKPNLYYDAANQIERLRAENEKFFNQAEMNARLLTENTDLRAELKLSEDMLRSQAKSIEKLVSRIEYSEEAYVRLDASMNRLKAAFRINMLRAFPSMSHEEIDAEIAAAIRESGE